MDKLEFLTALRAKLWAVSNEDAQRTVEYYREMIEDRMEDGLTEEEAVAAIGDMDEIVKNILSATPVAQPIPQPETRSRRLRWWEILLLILGFPVWGSVAITVASVVFSVWISLWSVVISLYAAAVALAAAAIGCVIACFFMVGRPGEILVAAGSSLLCAGLAIFMFLLSNLAAKGMIELTRLTVTGVKRMFARKERTI